MRKHLNKLIVGTLCLSALFSCTRKSASTAEFAQYIYAYTNGIVSATTPVTIVLAAEQPDVEPNTEVNKKLFSFSPSIKGKTYWIDNKTIRFIPETGALKNGQTYHADFNLGEVMDVSKELKTFSFSFQVEEIHFSILTYPIDIAANTRNVATINGEIHFSVDAELADVQKIFSVKDEVSKTYEINIEPTNDSKNFRFSIPDIQRNEKSSKTLTITATGKPVGSNQVEYKKILIPSLSEFRVLSVRLLENEMLITFSEPISLKQNLLGLITISPDINFTSQIKDNKVRLFFDIPASVKELTLNIYTGILSSANEKLNEHFSEVFQLKSLNPSVEFVYNGGIIPNSENLVVPFRAVSLKSVDIKIIRIFESNVLMFMQDNNLSGKEQLRRSGRLIYKKKLRLNADPAKNIHRWEDYFIDLSGLIHQEAGAIYRIELSFTQKDAVYDCGDASDDIDPTPELTTTDDGRVTEQDEKEWDNPNSFYYYGESEYDWDLYEWKQKDNPCHPSYYMGSDRVVSCNVLATNIGIIAKANSENTLWVTVANILDAKPMYDVTVTAYNLQLQPIGSAKTDDNGFAVIQPKGKPFILVAELNKEKTYLRLVDGENNSTSRFDVGGKKIEKGLKGYIYGERGVWRPGDTLHINFILMDSDKKIPNNHPVSFEIFNPQGQFYNKQIATSSINGFYTFKLPTNPNAPTGLWNAYIKVGGVAFHKSFRIEAIKPNRLKINLSLPATLQAADKSLPVTLTSSWLTGATARNLKAKVEMSLSKVATQFKGYEKFIFNNPATNFDYSRQTVFDGTLNENGTTLFNLKLPKAEDAPGKLNAELVCRVFEQGGDASFYTQTVPFSPFTSYVGLSLNQPKEQYIETDKDHTFDIVTLNSDGKLVNRSNIEYKIYRIGWSWWWENNNESFSTYINSSSYTPVARGYLNTVNGKASFKFKVNYPEWGRYLVYVKDLGSGHATGGTVYIDWPSWRGRSDKKDPNSIKMLAFSTDKTSYKTDEEVTVIIPASSGGKALIAIENGSSVLFRDWIKLEDKGDTKYKFKVTKEMSPNFYIHISLLQPHAQTVNELPIRMYGIVPIMISNEESVLTPEITMPDVLRPEKEFTVSVSEKNGKAMTYTLAIVDDGLLDLTNFKTPNPWDEFYAREALGIRTWDMYDNVAGAYTGQYGLLFSIGGDESILKESGTKANRFKPVVKVLGPFALNRGATDKHKITLPPYVGSVRTMVVAGQDGSYGKAEKTTPVRAPLMLLSSLPRVISINEEVLLPVNIFAMEKNVEDVTIKVETSGLIKAVGATTKNIEFKNTGDTIIYFSMKTSEKTGVERVTITANSGRESAKEVIEIDVRNPNTAIVQTVSKVLNANENVNLSYSCNDWATLEVSRIPVIDISRRFDFLYDYPHFCSEQLVSRALPLLYISQFKNIDKEEEEKIKRNVNDAIRNIYSRQLNNGGIVYWASDNTANEWVTSYAGCFLVLAKEKGYEVNTGVLNKWKDYQRKQAQQWSSSSDLAQAYRLYSLALVGEPETGAMNRMKEMKNLSSLAQWRLAAAYAITGKISVANDIIKKLSLNETYSSNRYTFGSDDRDQAMILETLVLTDRMEEAFRQAQKIAKNLAYEVSFTTQSTAYALAAMGAFAGKTSGEMEFDWKLNGKSKSVETRSPVWQTPLTKTERGTVSLKNTGKNMLYASLTTKSIPLIDTLSPVSKNLQINVKYTTLSGTEINPNNLKQGTDFISIIEVRNISLSDNYKDLALTQIIPSGWEIFNEQAAQNVTYQDIRDDRVFTYFDLSRGQTKVIRIRLQASYAGTFTLPAVTCEAMYNTEAFVRTKAERVKVIQ
ncbi:MAG: alpha-2-macroglobulin [Bacteroidales bacterium]|jgi:uncharacterized protein YfaS (alpha-2-macroglobulin family)|nr:alpha-2-macroglobulin [Bacteroidales bacterium]